jgi:molybdopterin/thiamine biosynthesis adenylyltransferase
MKTVVIVGVGALGSHVALLGRNWETHLRVIDFDRVESKNTQSQFHTRMGQGKNKAKALQAAMQGMWGVKLDAHSVMIGSTNREVMFKHADLIIDCTDNFSAREHIQEYVKEHNIPCLHGCLSADGQMARVVWTEDFKPDKEDVEGEATCEDGANLPFHALAGAFIAQLAQRFLEDGTKQSWQLTPFSMQRLT